MKPRMLVLSILGLMGMALAGCGTSILGSTSPSTASLFGSPSATAPLNGEVAVAFPVVACTTITGASLGTQGWKPSVLLAPIPTALVGKVEFYSDGTHTVLAPTGWVCSQSQTTDTTAGLAVYPSNNPNPPVLGPPPPGTEGVFATFDTTGHPHGVAMVCPFFTVASFQKREAGCSATRPTGEVSSLPTPDVASVSDPAGVTGALAGSGGAHAVTGVVIFPQVVPAVTYGSSINVAEESCSLTEANLCPTVLSDFEVREFPVPASSIRTTAPAATPTTAPAAPPAPTPTAPPTTAPASSPTPTDPSPTSTSPPTSP